MQCLSNAGSCGVRSWQNGTRCRGGVKVLWCHSHLVWLVFESTIPTCTCFYFRKLFVTCFCCCFFFFVLLFRNDKREERWEGKTHGQLFCPHKTKNHQMLPSEIVNSYITLLYLWEFRAYKSPSHFMWTTIRFST